MISVIVYEADWRVMERMIKARTKNNLHFLFPIEPEKSFFTHLSLSFGITCRGIKADVWRSHQGKPQIKKRFQTDMFLMNWLKKGWGFFFFFPCSIPTDPQVLVAVCSINQYFSKSKCAVILLLFGKRRLKKVEESML